MKRRVFIEYLDKNIVKLTTFSKQKTFNLSHWKEKGEYVIDLITLKVYELKDFNKDVAFTLNIQEQKIYFINKTDKNYFILGSTGINSFTWFNGTINYPNIGTTIKSEKTNEGLFEVNLVE
jgi:hypothetical protein